MASRGSRPLKSWGRTVADIRRRALTDPRSYIISLIYSAMNCQLASVSGFLPTISASLSSSL